MGSLSRWSIQIWQASCGLTERRFLETVSMMIKNGYIDDVNGWNFSGNAKHDTQEAIREYVRLRKIYENRADTNNHTNDSLYIYWQRRSWLRRKM